MELYHKAGIEAAAERTLPRKKSPKGLRQGQIVKSFVLLSALGGDCIEDMERLRQYEGLEAMLGYPPPAAETVRQWLDNFHDDGLRKERPPAGVFLSSRVSKVDGAQGAQSAGNMDLCQQG